MKMIGVRELRQNASRYLALVEAGEQVAITNRGRIVAHLVPIEQQERSRQTLIDAGILSPALNPSGLQTITADALPRRDLTPLLHAERNEPR